MYTPEEFSSVVMAKAVEQGFLESEVFFEAGSATEISVLHGEISMYESSSMQGVSFRGRYNDQMGYAYAEELTDEAILFLLDQAKQNCMVLESDEKETVYEGDSSYEEFSSYEESLTKLSFEELSAMVLTLEKRVLAFDPRIKAVDHCVISCGSSEHKIWNSKGLCLSFRSNLVVLYANARCEENDITKTGSAYRALRDLSMLDIDELAREIAMNALEKLGASSISSGTMNVVLDREAAADLLSTFAGIFSADMVQKGFSLLGGKIGERIASPVVTLRDDARAEGSIAGIPFDSEGVATKNKVLVENGVLKGFLHNRKTAAKENSESTGNGFRSGFKGSIGVGATNFYILPGEKDLAALIQQAGNGVYLKELSGLHAGTNVVSGDFSLSCEGFVIADGRIGRAVDQITIAENFFALLMKIREVGSDQYFQIPSDSGSTGCPSLLLENIAISGE